MACTSRPATSTPPSRRCAPRAPRSCRSRPSSSGARGTLPCGTRPATWCASTSRPPPSICRMTERRAILSGSTFEEQIGYARAVVDGDWVHVSGTTGFDYATMTISDDVAEQARQCLRNIAAALAEAGCTFADVVRVRYLLPDREDFEPCWPLLRTAFGEVRPAATMQVCGL